MTGTHNKDKLAGAFVGGIRTHGCCDMADGWSRSRKDSTVLTASRCDITNRIPRCTLHSDFVGRSSGQAWGCSAGLPQVYAGVFLKCTVARLREEQTEPMGTIEVLE